MVDTTPLKEYLHARDLYHMGEKDKALILLAKSLGATEPTAIMEDALEQMLEGNDAALTLVIHQAKGDK
jgi:hypothetical protein